MITEKTDVVIQLRNVNKTFRIKENKSSTIRDKVFNLFKSSPSKEIKALDNINLEIKKGELLGIIGGNGSGKSTLLKTIIGALKPDGGEGVITKGKIIRLALGMGFNPHFTARDNIYINASILGLSFKEIGNKFDEILSFAELEDFVDTPIKFFSSGMRSRLAFSIAIHVDADILLMDEFFGGVGDKRFRQQSEEVFKNTFIKGKTILLVSHNTRDIEKHCDRVILIDKGRIIRNGLPKDVLDAYKKMVKIKKK